MLRNAPLPEPSQSPSHPIRRASHAASPWTLALRLGTVERELRVQFIRIAQLQAQLDRVVRAFGDDGPAAAGVIVHHTRSSPRSDPARQRHQRAE